MTSCESCRPASPEAAHHETGHASFWQNLGLDPDALPDVSGRHVSEEARVMHTAHWHSAAVDESVYVMSGIAG